MSSYPAIFDVAPPARHERLQVALRVLISVVLGIIGISLGWVFGLMYFVLPALAAIVVQWDGPAHYLSRTAPGLVGLMRWLLSFEAYMLFLTDRFPMGGETLVRFEVTPTGEPTPASALLRLLTSLPELIVLMILGCVSGIICFLSLLTVLFAEMVPAPFLAFQRGVVRWQARLMAYHASLVAAAPPYALETQPA